MSINGILNINKPQGKTSFEVVTLVRRLSGERRVGHIGTLDPMATGVLPVCIGQGTRVSEFLAGAHKTYRAEIELGITTDTYDATGRITCRQNASSITVEEVEKGLQSFHGSIEQVPPLYSAIKHNGKRLYELARSGIEVERKPRKVDIFSLEIVDLQLPVVTIEVVCGKGTYMRSLAYDLGQALGTGAYLKNLVRLRNGIFDISGAISLPQLEDAFSLGYWQSLLNPIDCVLYSMKAVIVDRESMHAIRNGRPFPLKNYMESGLLEDTSTSLYPGEFYRAYSIDGCFLAVLRFQPEEGLLFPHKVFCNCSCS